MEFIGIGVGKGVPALPEKADELLSFPCACEPGEHVFFGFGHDGIDKIEPFLMNRDHSFLGRRKESGEKQEKDH